jgi:DNA-binding CsgD family transcriptional regulator
MRAVDVSIRESEVLELVGEHLTNREISERLYLSVRTVESHVSSLLRKLGLNDRRALAVFASAAPLISRVPFPTRLALRSPFPFSGRTGQLDALEAMWADTTAGERRVVFVSGEAGIGKTRLAAEVARRIHDQGGVVLFGRCDEDMGVGFQPFVEALEQMVQVGMSPASLGSHAGDLVRLAPDLAQVVPDLAPPLRSDPETERYRLFDAVAAWLGALSSSTGVLLVLDDLHWTEKPTVLLLRHLIRSAEPMRLMVLATYRDTEVESAHPLGELLADLRSEPGVDRLALGGLDVGGVSELLASTSEQSMDLQGSELAELLRNQTQGNPFFIGEILRAMVESGTLVQRDGIWTTEVALSDLSIPEGVREVVSRRLSRLSANANALLALASAIGSTLDASLLTAISDVGEDAVLDALDEATSASLLKETSTGAYEFTHALVRATLNDGSSGARRAQRHRRIAEALQDRPGADPVALTYHFRRIGNPDVRTVDFATAAGEQALSRLAFDQAVTFFSQAIETTEALPADARRRCALLIKLGTAQRLAAIAAHRETLLDAARLAQTIGNAELLVAAALANSRGLYSMVGNVDLERVAVLEAACESLVGTESVEMANVCAQLALELTYAEEFGRRRVLADQALSIARSQGDLSLLAWVICRITYAIDVPDTLVERHALSLEAHTAAESLGDPTLQVFCGWSRFIALYQSGDVEDGDVQLLAAKQLAEKLGQPTLRWIMTVFDSGRALLAGDLDEAERLGLEALEIGTASGQPDTAIIFGAQIAHIRVRQGRGLELVDLLRQLVADTPGIPGFAALLAMIFCDVDRPDAAREVLAPFVVDRFSSVPRDNVWLLTMCAMAYTAAELDWIEAASVLFDRLQPFADHLPCSGPVHLCQVTYYLGRLAATLGRGDDADLYFSQSSSTHERIGANWSLTTTQLAWGEFLIARGDPGDLERSTGLLERALASARDNGYRLAEHRSLKALEALGGR